VCESDEEEKEDAWEAGVAKVNTRKRDLSAFGSLLTLAHCI